MRTTLQTRMRVILTALVIVVALWACQQSVAQPSAQVLSLALDRWRVSEGAFPARPKQNGWELAIGSNDPKGQWFSEIVIDVEKYPFFAFRVSELSRECAWSVAAYDTQGRHRQVLQQDTTGFGQYIIDLRKMPGWTGRAQFRIEFSVRGPAGRQNWILLKEAGFYQTSPSHGDADGVKQTVLNSERMNRALVKSEPDSVSLSLMNAQGAEWEWGGALSKVTVDTDRYPFAELDVRQLSTNANFRFGVGGMTSGPEDRNAGVLSFNYRDASHWQGSHEVDIQMILGGIGAHVEYTPIRFLTFPSLSAPLVSRADGAAPEEAQPEGEIVTGAFQLGYEPKNGLFRITRKDRTASLVTRFMEMDGVTLTPMAMHKSRIATGERLSFTHHGGNVSFAVSIDTVTAAPGLFHWRVTATPDTVARFASCGHEVCYVSAPGTKGNVLRRIAGQSWSASGISNVSAPGVGNALYFQNYTALNPVFERCRIAPRFWVSASARTFGFPNPMDSRATFPANTPVVLSDAWLYLSPDDDTGSPPDNTREAAKFLQGLAAIFDQLPDKPATEWLDWQKLARTSLQDLYNGECWASWENGIYLKAYVGTVGASPQLTGMQDVIGPLLAFLNQTGEGRDMYNRLRAEIPHFWSDKRGSLLLFANDPNSNWWSIEQIVGVCRAALNGDAEAKTLCLKSAPTLMRLAADGHYGFQHFTEFKNESLNEKEFGGVFLLYMMQLYEMSGDRKYVEEAKRAADAIASWEFSSAKLASFCGMTCEGLARLYAATGDRRYLEISQIPLAGLLRNAWLWQCRYGHCKDYTTFFGFNSDASGVDYITAADQHQVWYSLYQYYLRAHSALDHASDYLVAEALRYVPQSAWYTYPPNLPPASLHNGVPFWHSKNLFELAIPVEDLNDGWRKNGSVGQELYGVGAAFEFASKAYIRVPKAGAMVFCEYPILDAAWDSDRKSLTVQVGGSAHQTVKFEIRADTIVPGAGLAAKDARLNISYTTGDHAGQVHRQQGSFEDGRVRLIVPGGSRIEISVNLGR